MNRFDTTSITDLAELVVRDGLDAHPADMFALADRASTLGVSDVLLSVMLSAQEPSVARERAFNRVASVVAHRGAPGGRFSQPNRQVVAA